MFKIIASATLLAAFVGCASVQPLDQIAARAKQPRGFANEVVVDTSSRSVGGIKKLAWAGYTVTLECEAKCNLTREEQRKIAEQLASQSFESFDRELRANFASSAEEIQIQEVNETTSATFFAQEIRTESLTSRIGKWFEKLKLNHEPPVSVSPSGLKTLNPNEIGWSGETSLQKLGQALGVDGVLVGHVKVMVSGEGESDSALLEIDGPKLWVFSSKRASGIAAARLRQSWSPHTADRTTLDLNGIDVVAKAYSEQFVRELRTIR
ncbi:MAG TPA: hypothetical protein PLH57_00430 [Oligoflexia bacterium]|nr:hypothetical protein [Oligoflexia bacterium]